MKGIKKNYDYYLKYFYLFCCLIIFLTGCDGIAPVLPIINSFSANIYILKEGDTAILSWSVTDATTVTIYPEGDIVSLSGSTSITPSSTTTYVLTATNSAGSNTATVTITVSPAIVEQTLTIQPGPEEGKDSMVIWEDNPDINYGSHPDLMIGNSSDYYYRSFLQFDLSTLPTHAVIVNADLSLYQYDTSGTEDLSIALHLVTESWEESSIIWTDQANYTAPETTISVIAGESTWLSWDLTSILQEWLDGITPNYGIVLTDVEEFSGQTFIYCHSSDYTTDPTLRPRLEIVYYVP